MVKRVSLKFLLGGRLPFNKTVEATAVDFVEVTLLYAGLLWSLREACEARSVDLIEIALGEAAEPRSIDFIEVALLRAESHATETQDTERHTLSRHIASGSAQAVLSYYLQKAPCTGFRSWGKMFDSRLSTVYVGNLPMFA